MLAPSIIALKNSTQFLSLLVLPSKQVPLYMEPQHTKKLVMYKLNPLLLGHSDMYGNFYFLIKNAWETVILTQ